MNVGQEFNFRNAKEIILQNNPDFLNELYVILREIQLDMTIAEGKSQRDPSNQIQKMFVSRGWNKEINCSVIPEMKYDLVRDKHFPIEIEIGHMRLVYADFFKFLADYSKECIKAGIMIVCNDPSKWEDKWHNSLKSTENKLKAVRGSFLVPVLVIGVDP